MFGLCSAPYLAQILPHSGDMFLQAGTGAENTKEKSKQCFTIFLKCPHKPVEEKIKLFKHALH
jgi:hypothetical protein